ncbi:MAG: flagellar FliJ family protein [Propionibacteriales bacterium]|nr:flagellar FliJ family protein [Propionibacteriales bacterium]
MSTVHDPGLHAVARVRGVRETDSRIGLRTAWNETRAAQSRVDDLRGQLEQASAFSTGSAASFLALRQSLQVLGDVLIAAEDARDASQLISDTAYARWQVDRTRLAAVENLLERRSAARSAEVARKEAAELDDIAAQRWLRREVNR